MKRNCMVVIVFFITCSIFGSPAYTILDEAFKNLDKVNLKNWSYTMTTVSHNKKTVEKYNPLFTEDIKWKLILKEGKQPTEKELDDYLREKKKHQEKSSSDEDGNGVSLSESLVKDSVTLIKKTDSQYIFGFKPSGDSDEEQKMLKNMKGKITLNRETQSIECFEIYCEKPFSPILGVKIKEFQSVSKFEPIGENGDNLPVYTKMITRGRAFGIKKIDEEVEVVFSDFSYHGKEKP